MRTGHESHRNRCDHVTDFRQDLSLTLLGQAINSCWPTALTVKLVVTQFQMVSARAVSSIDENVGRRLVSLPSFGAQNHSEIIFCI
jgi:hypothetical protein